MDGYGLSIDELRTVCHRVAADVDDISRQADEVRHSEVLASDFGTGTDVGASYVRVTHGPLADSLRSFSAASEDVISKLYATFARYQHADENARSAFRPML
ncbi:hypothetical protein ACFQ1S_09510 [Kibdelosporangium lantanae]|uniref:Excreted virulence factor EspC, type VII ESX diderm n=1 Tax=Kibdelosporangium lantanae TaxID=1497396 RepID=A0ABW3M4Z2_9PSEU